MVNILEANYYFKKKKEKDLFLQDNDPTFNFELIIKWSINT